MDNNLQSKMAADIAPFRLPRYAQIPDIGLYLEQVAEQLARLMFIAAVKPVVPLEGLRLMFGIQEGSYALCTAYDYFCDEFENMLFAAFGVAPAAQGLGETRSAAKDLLRNTVSGIVNKIYLDRYLSDYQDRLAQEGSSSEAVPEETERLCAEKK